jgi:hypothetical protein
MTMVMVGVGDLVQKTEDGCTGWVLGGRAIERSVALCAVYTVHIEMR